MSENVDVSAHKDEVAAVATRRAREEEDDCRHFRCDDAPAKKRALGSPPWLAREEDKLLLPSFRCGDAPAGKHPSDDVPSRDDDRRSVPIRTRGKVWGRARIQFPSHWRPQRESVPAATSGTCPSLARFLPQRLIHDGDGGSLRRRRLLLPWVPVP